MGQIGEWVQKNQQLAQNAANAGSAITTGNNTIAPQAPTMPNTAPSKPSNYLTGQLVGNGGQANNLGK